MTYEILREHLTKKPFQPFRVVLTSGEEVEIGRRFQAVATVRNLFVGADDQIRSILLDQIDRVVETPGISQ